ncbi:MAG: glycosyltransferase family 2 protein [Anaerolineae bacterium]|nr:glycosyltransferase family 2 protein [Anaerolineae bacterium]
MVSLTFASVIIVNYNGAHFLPACLDALHRQTYPADRYEVIVADNGSTDDSLELLRDAYPWVKVYQTGSNLGFAGGNNAAIRIARGDYIILLNNDTAAAPDWVEQLVAVADQHPRAGIVTGRTQLFYDQLEVTLCSEAALHVYEVDSGLPWGVVQYLDGFGGWERDASDAHFRRMNRRGVIGVPVPHGERAWEAPVTGFTLRLRLASPSPTNVAVCTGNQSLAHLQTASAPEDYAIHVPSHAAEAAGPMVQNAGSIIFANGNSRDRGTIVKNNEVLYETDHDQFNIVEEVFAACGGNMLMRRAMLEDVGLLDDDFFMYYEDTDLSWRAWLRGWQVLYAPRAIVRHVHCGSSKEWSPLFLYNVERNRLAMLIKNGSLQQAVGETARYSVSVLKALAGSAAARLLARPGSRAQWDRTIISARALGSLTLSLPSLLRKRAHIQRTRRRPQAEIEQWFQRQ